MFREGDEFSSELARKNFKLPKTMEGEYELKDISFKANVDFCIADGDWRKATITKFYNYKDKIFGEVKASHIIIIPSVSEDAPEDEIAEAEKASANKSKAKLILETE